METTENMKFLKLEEIYLQNYFRLSFTFCFKLNNIILVDVLNIRKWQKSNLRILVLGYSNTDYSTTSAKFSYYL